MPKTKKPAVSIEIYVDKKGEFRPGFVWNQNGETVSDGYTRRNNCIKGVKKLVAALAAKDFEIVIVKRGQKRPSVIRKEQRKKIHRP